MIEGVNINMKIKKLGKIIIGMYCAVAVVFLAFPMKKATAETVYLQSWALYDSGMHIDYKNAGSSYYSYVKNGASTWNKYKAGVFREDKWNTINDLTIKDVNVENNINATTYSSGYIKFNKYNMSSKSTARKKNIATHELGHALGINHIPYSNDLMYPYDNGVYKLTITDQLAYDSAYSFFKK